MTLIPLILTLCVSLSLSCSEFLGCLSFGVKHLVHKTRHGRAITGAYHILPESMGHRKHILVDNTNENIQPSEPQTPANTTPKSVPTPVSIPTPFRPGAGTISQSRMEETLVEKDEFIRKTVRISFTVYLHKIRNIYLKSFNNGRFCCYDSLLKMSVF